MNTEKIKKFLLIGLIAVSTIFISGFNNSYALSSKIENVQVNISRYVSEKHSMEECINYAISVTKDAGLDYAYYYDAYPISTTMYTFVNFYVFDYSNVYFTFNPNVPRLECSSDIGQCSFNNYNFNSDNISYRYINGSKDELEKKLYCSRPLLDKDSNPVFPQPLVKAAENLIPAVMADTKTIVTVVGVFLIFLVVSLTQLRKVLRAFSGV